MNSQAAYTVKGVGGMDSYFNTSSVQTMNYTVGNGSGSASCSLMEVSAHPFLTVTYSLIFLVGLVLNGFTVRVYFCRAQRRQSNMTVYLQNLAAADFFLSLCLPLRIANYATHNSTLMRHVYCNFGATAFYLNMYASILFMDYIAANRYLKIVRPLETHALQTVRAAHYISMATWVTLLAPSSAYLTVSLLTTWGADLIPGNIGCDALHSTQLLLLNKIIHSFSAAIFLFVLFSLLFFYWGTILRLRQAQLNQQKHPSCGSGRNLSRSKRNMLVLVAVFCVCFVPYHLVRLPYTFLRPFLRRCYWHQAFYYMKELTVLLSVLNACLDPLIYFIFCKSFRAQLGMQRRFSTTMAQPDSTAPPPGDGRISQGNLTTLSRTQTRTSFSMSRRASVI
ncbi:P2Y purinoceptor 14 isoform X2 [Salmo trutta]|uniref:Probable G-protein coupled receptor 34 n=1 Tax=Salmo trutta TaxID=8032 RepID=A0A674ASI0_SALTR|nr:probable G-protein coupled receptor 171 isoform X2 [Salmo trutta]